MRTHTLLNVHFIVFMVPIVWTSPQNLQRVMSHASFVDAIVYSRHLFLYHLLGKSTVAVDSLLTRVMSSTVGEGASSRRH